MYLWTYVASKDSNQTDYQSSLWIQYKQIGKILASYAWHVELVFAGCTYHKVYFLLLKFILLHFLETGE